MASDSKLTLLSKIKNPKKSVTKTDKRKQEQGQHIGLKG